MNLLGIEISGTRLQFVTGTAEGKILDRQQLSIERARGGEGVRERLAQLAGRLQPRLDWCAVGVGCGAVVDWRTGHVHGSSQLAGWEDFPLGDWLRELTGLPVAVDNDSNVAAFAEATCGAGMGANPVFYAHAGSGTGGGCVVDGRIYHGAAPGEAQIGHVRLDRGGTLVEERCSGRALDRLVVEAARAEPDSLLARVAAAEADGAARALGPAAAEGCPVAARIVVAAGEDLAFALSHVVHLFHPEVIVLGGEVSLIGEPWREAVAGPLPTYVMEAFQPVPEVRLASFGELAVPRGALLLAAEACGARGAKESPTA